MEGLGGCEGERFGEKLESSLLRMDVRPVVAHGRPPALLLPMDVHPELNERTYFDI